MRILRGDKYVLAFALSIVLSLIVNFYSVLPVSASPISNGAASSALTNSIFPANHLQLSEPSIAYEMHTVSNFKPLVVGPCRMTDMGNINTHGKWITLVGAVGGSGFGLWSGTNAQRIEIYLHLKYGQTVRFRGQGHRWDMKYVCPDKNFWGEQASHYLNVRTGLGFTMGPAVDKETPWYQFFDNPFCQPMNMQVSEVGTFMHLSIQDSQWNGKFYSIEKGCPGPPKTPCLAKRIGDSTKVPDNKPWKINVPAHHYYVINDAWTNFASLPNLQGQQWIILLKPQAHTIYFNGRGSLWDEGDAPRCFNPTMGEIWRDVAKYQHTAHPWTFLQESALASYHLVGSTN